MANNIMENKEDQGKLASGINILAGIWLVLSPFILNYANLSTALWNDVIIGAAVLIFAAIREWGSEEETGWSSWTNVVLGIWLILSPFILGFGYHSGALWNNVILGIVVSAFAGWSGSTRYVPRHQM